MFGLILTQLSMLTYIECKILRKFPEIPIVCNFVNNPLSREYEGAERDTEGVGRAMS